MGFTDWTHDKDARAFHRVVDAAFTPIVERLFPSYKIMRIGLVTDNDFDREEVEVRIHLKKTGDKMPDESFFNGRFLPQKPR